MLFCLLEANDEKTRRQHEKENYFSTVRLEICFSVIKKPFFLESIENGMGLFTGIYLAMATAAQPSGVLNLLMVLYSSMRQVATQTILYVKHKKKIKTPRQPGDNDFDQVVQTLTTIGMAAVVPGRFLCDFKTRKVKRFYL